MWPINTASIAIRDANLSLITMSNYEPWDRTYVFIWKDWSISWTDSESVSTSVLDSNESEISMAFARGEKVWYMEIFSNDNNNG